ncbi:MAG: hypothetical protein MN733_31205, partial [Nitrososphaera sp.]|nr:hypothetical protein [Nitrososphaera sp.]
SLNVPKEGLQGKLHPDVGKVEIHTGFVRDTEKSSSDRGVRRKSFDCYSCYLFPRNCSAHDSLSSMLNRVSQSPSGGYVSSWLDGQCIFSEVNESVLWLYSQQHIGLLQ